MNYEGKGDCATTREEGFEGASFVMLSLRFYLDTVATIALDWMDGKKAD